MAEFCQQNLSAFPMDTLTGMVPFEVWHIQCVCTLYLISHQTNSRFSTQALHAWMVYSMTKVQWRTQQTAVSIYHSLLWRASEQQPSMAISPCSDMQLLCQCHFNTVFVKWLKCMHFWYVWTKNRMGSLLYIQQCHFLMWHLIKSLTPVHCADKKTGNSSCDFARTLHCTSILLLGGVWTTWNWTEWTEWTKKPLTWCAWKQCRVGLFCFLR